jgi:hypothetical protein
MWVLGLVVGIEKQEEQKPPEWWLKTRDVSDANPQKNAAYHGYCALHNLGPRA